jgi:hypothetical protein
MQGTNSRFITNIVPLQNIQTNISGQGVQQNILNTITAVQTSITALQTSINALQTSITEIQARLVTLEGKVG